MAVTISSSLSFNNQERVKTPIYGKIELREDSHRAGVWTRSVILADSDSCSGGSPGENGESCLMFGGGVSGVCILTKKSTIKQGGTSGVPYVQRELVYMGTM